jgi:hypothetical protein
MGSAIIINTTKFSIEEESKLEEYLINNNIQYTDSYFSGKWVDVSIEDCDCDCDCDW